MPRWLPPGRPVAGRRRALRQFAGAGTWLGLGGVAAALSGCAAPRPPLRIGAIVFPGYELLFLGRELGQLPESQVRLIELRSNTDTLRALAARQLEGAALTMDEVLAARADGIDLRVILVLDVSAGSDVLLGKPHVRTLSDLQGRRIGVESGATGAVMLGSALSAAGLAVDQIDKVSSTLDTTMETWVDGRVDAIVTAEPWASRLEADGAVRLFDSAAIPGRIVDVIAVRRDVAEQRGDALRLLVAAHFAGLAHWRTQALASSTMLAPRLQVAPADVATTFRGLELPDMARNRALLRTGGELQAPMAALMQVMVQQGLLRSAIVLDEVLDPRFLPSSST